MSSVSKSAGAVPVHKSKAKAAQTRRGLLYALPDWLMIIVLFFVPIVLLVVMACSRWSQDTLVLCNHCWTHAATHGILNDNLVGIRA